jgi:hypothetical protein
MQNIYSAKHARYDLETYHKHIYRFWMKLYLYANNYKHGDIAKV